MFPEKRAQTQKPSSPPNSRWESAPDRTARRVFGGSCRSARKGLYCYGTEASREEESS